MGCLGWFAPQHGTAGPRGRFIEQHSAWRRAAPALPVPSHSAENGRAAATTKTRQGEPDRSLHSTLSPLAALPLLPTGSSRLREQQR